MNRDGIDGNGKAIKEKVRKKWRKIRNDDRDAVEGKREELVGRFRKRYGKGRDEAKREVDEWAEQID